MTITRKIIFGGGFENILRGLAAMTENEKELAKQILEKLKEMDTKLARIEDSVGELNGKETSTSVEGKLNDVKSVHKGLQATFEQGFADIHEGLAEIKEVKQIKKNGKQVH